MVCAKGRANFVLLSESLFVLVWKMRSAHKILVGRPEEITSIPVCRNDNNVKSCFEK
jgi:hypothetical protein